MRDKGAKRTKARHLSPLERFDMEENVLQEFREKEELFRYGYERGLSPVEWNKIDLSSFLDTLFHRGKGFEECFEEVQSPEYQIWRKQKDEQEKRDRLLELLPIPLQPDYFQQRGREEHPSYLLKDDFKMHQWLQGRQFAIMPPATSLGDNNWNQKCPIPPIAIAIDLDGVTPEKLEGFFWMMSKPEYFPLPNILVNSGHGLHVYFCLKNPYPFIMWMLGKRSLN